MIKAYLVKNKRGTALKLWKKEEGKFQVIMQGAYQMLLTGPSYILINKKAIEVFELTSKENLEIFPVKIERKSTGKLREDYFELKIKNKFRIDELLRFSKNEEMVWMFQTQYLQHLIVSERVKIKLEKCSDWKLVFSDEESDLFG